MHSEAEHLEKLTQDFGAAPRSLAWVRALLAFKALALIGLMALSHDQPEVMLVGLAPLALLAAEAAWHLPDGLHWRARR